jgi:hypothetical protein
MINNPKAIAIMNQDVKKIMVPYFTSHPELLDRVFAPDIAVNSYVDTTLAGIKIRITNYAHGSGSAFGINIMLDSISFVHFDEYNKLSVDDYKTIGFTQLPTDVALLGSTLLNGDQQMIKNTYNTSGLLTFSHIENYTTTLYDTLTKHAAKLNALGYQTSILVWPMQMFSYKKTNKGMGLITLNSAPKLNRSILYLNVEKNKTSVVSIKNTFIDADLNDKLRYSFTINDLPLPEWAKFDSLKQELTLTPTEVKTYTLTITATDNHLCFANTSFLLKVTEPEAIENMRENSKFKVYPNPAKSVINIESPGDQKSSYSVNLYNMLGEKVYSGYECKNNKLTIDLSKFSESVMFLTITSNGTIECHKIIKH